MFLTAWLVFIHEHAVFHFFRVLSPIPVPARTETEEERPDERQEEKEVGKKDTGINVIFHRRQVLAARCQGSGNSGQVPGVDNQSEIVKTALPTAHYFS